MDSNGQSDTISEGPIHASSASRSKLIGVLHARSGDEVDQRLSRDISGVAQLSWSILAARGKELQTVNMAL